MKLSDDAVVVAVDMAAEGNEDDAVSDVAEAAIFDDDSAPGSPDVDRVVIARRQRAVDVVAAVVVA